jgi:hypothetical protein
MTPRALRLLQIAFMLLALVILTGCPTSRDVMLRADSPSAQPIKYGEHSPSDPKHLDGRISSHSPKPHQ